MLAPHRITLLNRFIRSTRFIRLIRIIRGLDRSEMTLCPTYLILKIPGNVWCPRLCRWTRGHTIQIFQATPRISRIIMIQINENEILLEKKTLVPM